MKRVLTAAALALALSACGGGGGSTSPGLPKPSPGAPAGGTATTSATVKITIPAQTRGASARRRALYISANTNSLTVTSNVNSTVTTIPLTPSSPGCTANGDGSRTCVVNLNLPPGTNEFFTVKTFAGATPGPTDTPLSIVSMTQTIVAGQPNPISLTLNAVVGSVTAAISPQPFVLGTPCACNVVVNVLDASGATIVIPANALVDAGGNPATISLLDTDRSGATSLSDLQQSHVLQLNPITDTSGADPITLNYNGAKPLAAGELTATSTVANATSTSLTLFAGPSLYVLNSADNTIAEYALSAAGLPQTPVRRVVGGADLTCQSYAAGSQFVPAYTGLTMDSAGNVYTGFAADPNNAPPPCAGTSALLGFSPSAVGSGSAGTPATIALPPQPDAVDEFEVEFDSSAFDVNQNLFDLTNFVFTGLFETFHVSGTSATLTETYGANGPNPPCLNFLNVGACAHAHIQFAQSGSGTEAFAINPNTGDVFVGGSLEDATTFHFVIAGVPQGAANAIQKPKTEAAWIFDPTPTSDATLLDDPIALQFDGNILYVLNGGDQFGSSIFTGPGACFPTSTNPNTNTASNCSDGNFHEFVTAYDTSQLSGKNGAVALTPLFVLGGTALPISVLADGVTPNPFGPFGSQPSPGGMWESNGVVYVVNPCDLTCINGFAANGIVPAGDPGSIEVFTVPANGTVNLSATPTLLQDTYVNNPVNLIVGQQGTGIGTQALRRLSIAGKRLRQAPLSAAQLQRRQQFLARIKALGALRGQAGAP